MFQMIACDLAVLTIAMIFYAWRDGYIARSRRQAVLNDRVAYMLWMAAQRIH
ncbi:hypothetical protein [Fimbriiglobus ruber]|uniref:Uncharacterized protein n=1 Tax=Fimbriiglobus ruber TaxID=1908690 RepID=A0A225D2R4_9BACT|nr:hypothetical protein [Fimbriiglobus ruber]OWK35880.1 hypothetical protein FRUB_08443 [Fimbriiglobus ruber]